MGTISYQWQAAGTNIAGATGANYLLTEAEVGKAITVVASYTDGHGTSESIISAATAAVANLNDAPTGSVTISGIAAQGQTLTASNTLADVDGVGSITYTWQSNGSTVGTGSTYTLTEAEVGKAITVVASYTDGHNTNESVISTATAVVANLNDAPTGSVTISGTPTQGQTLTASNTLADVDGLGTISYQWQAGGVDIAGATNNSYLLTEAEVGKQITVVASYTDGHGTNESVSSAATAAVANVNDAPTGSVTISGTAIQGQILTAGNTLADADGLGTISYQWQAAGTNIAGATGASYTLTEAEVGKVITVIASYTDSHGTAESVTSAQTAAVANVNDLPTGSVTISGTATQGQILTAADTLADADGMGTISYQWQAGGTNITGATAGTYTLTEAEVDKVITVIASYTDDHGTAESVTSSPTSAVTNVNDAPTGSVTISGTPIQGQTLTAANTLDDADGLGVITYTWQADGSDIGTGNSYTLTEADVGSQISVQVSYTDWHGTAESVTSAQTAPVANVNDAPTGLPTISGTVTEDQTLTAVTSGISDADGLGAFSYQWLRDGVAITGATNSNYTLGDADVGTQISLQVSYTDMRGTTEGPLTSAQTASVANVNDAPVADNDSANTNEDTPVTVNLVANDTDVEGDTLVVSAVTQGTNGTVTFAGGSVTYTPNGNFNGSDSFTYTVSDGNGGSATATVNVTVNPVNDAPTGAVTITGTPTEDQVLTADVLSISDAGRAWAPFSLPVADADGRHGPSARGHRQHLHPWRCRCWCPDQRAGELHRRSGHCRIPDQRRG